MTAAPGPRAGQARGRPDGFRHGAGKFDRYPVTDNAGDGRSVTTNQYQSTTVVGNRLRERSEIGAFAVTTGNQHDPSLIGGQALQCRHSGPDIGALGVVDVFDAVYPTHQLAAMGQPREVPRHFQHGVHREPGGIAQCQRGHDIADVMAADQLQLAGTDQVVKAEGYPGAVIIVAGAEGVRIDPVKPETQEAQVVPLHRGTESIIKIDDGILAAPENTLFGLEIIHLAVVTVHMVVTDIQHGGGQSSQLFRSFQLEARQFEYIQLRSPTEQLQRRGTDVAADSDLATSRRGHFTHQGGYRGFTVGAGNRDNWCIGGLGKQVDITTNLCPRAAAA